VATRSAKRGAVVFEELRPRPTGVAHGLLGSPAEAEDTGLRSPAAGHRGEEDPMEARFDMQSSEVATQFVRRFVAASQVVEPAIPRTVAELVRIRASQINGCGFCTDMHTKDALAAGETQQRLNLVAAWRDAAVFTEAERAALAMAEEGTRIADAATGVSDETWQAARKHFDDEELAALIVEIAMINAWNRLNVIVGTPAGGYQPGQPG
jgi:AhpD family alkylhydroperoxidase